MCHNSLMSYSTSNRMQHELNHKTEESSFTQNLGLKLLYAHRAERKRAAKLTLKLQLKSLLLCITHEKLIKSQCNHHLFCAMIEHFVYNWQKVCCFFSQSFLLNVRALWKVSMQFGKILCCTHELVTNELARKCI